jgi:hypothetical protein
VEETTPGAPVWEKMVEVLALMGAAGANVSPCADGGHANGAEAQPEDALGRIALTPESLKGPGFSPSWEATLDDVMSVLGSFDIVDLGARATGYPRAPLLLANWGCEQAGGGCRVDMFVGCDRAPTAEGDANHGWSRCSTTGPG